MRTTLIPLALLALTLAACGGRMTGHGDDVYHLDGTKLTATIEVGDRVMIDLPHNAAMSWTVGGDDALDFRGGSVAGTVAEGTAIAPGVEVLTARASDGSTTVFTVTVTP